MGISKFDFYSSAYLDVSVRQVRLLSLCIREQDKWVLPTWVSPFGYPRVNALFQLTEAFRRLTRPSSPVDAKASTNSP
jgi:hypothetical protein